MTTLRPSNVLAYYHSKHPILMTRTIIINASPHCSSNLEEIFDEYVPSIEIVGIAATIDDAKSLLKTKKPDLIILDLEFEDDAPFALLDTQNHPAFKIIFTASNDKFALRAFKYEAVDYILKPFKALDVLDAINKVKRTQFNQVNYSRLEYLIHQNPINRSNRITIPTSTGINVISISDILHIEADRSYCCIHLAGGERLLVSKPLKEIEELLPLDLFFRCHSAFLVNLNYVKKFIKDNGGHIVLNDGSKVPLARRRKHEFIERLKNH